MEKESQLTQYVTARRQREDNIRTKAAELAHAESQVPPPPVRAVGVHTPVSLCLCLSVSTSVCGTVCGFVCTCAPAGKRGEVVR